MDKISLIVRSAMEGNGIRNMQRLYGYDSESIQAILLGTGIACSALHDRLVRRLDIDYVQMDELWAFVGLKEKTLKRQGIHPTIGHQKGTVWTHMALHPHSMLIISYLLGRRKLPFTFQFIKDLHSRLARRVTLASDGFPNYVPAVWSVFGPENVDYGMYVKIEDEKGHHCDAQKRVIFGNPDLDLIKTTSIENRNLHYRMRTRRIQRKTNGHSKEIMYHYASLALWAAHHNFCTQPRRLKKATPAMAAGITQEPWSVRRLILEATTALVTSQYQVQTVR
jgi:IS1 family transposase